MRKAETALFARLISHWQNLWVQTSSGRNLFPYFRCSHLKAAVGSPEVPSCLNSSNLAAAPLRVWRMEMPTNAQRATESTGNASIPFLLRFFTSHEGSTLWTE